MSAGSRKLTSSALALTALLVASLWLGMAGIAQGASTRLFVSSFGSFSSVQGIAVDQSSGDVYVLDTGTAGGSLMKFDASGNPVKFTGLAGEPTSITGLGGGGSAENELAVDNSSGPAKGDVYVAVSSSNGEEIDIFAPDGQKLGTLNGSGSAPWGETCGVAVDSSGAVYVGLFGSIDKFIPSSDPVTNADYVSSIMGAHSACNLAVDSTGNVFAVAWPSGPVSRYEASQFGSISPTSSVVDTVGSTLAVDSSNDHVYVDQTDRVAEFGPEGEPFEEPVSTFGQGGEGSIYASFGIAVNVSTEHVYVSDGQGTISIFGPLVTVAEPSIEPASISGATVTLKGAVNPDGLPVTSCQFEYGAEEAHLTSTAPCSSSPGSGNAPVPVSATLSRLSSGETFYYRLAATNGNGTARSTTGSFVAPGPKVLEESFWHVGSAGADLSAQVEPNGASTSVYVEYGTTGAYGLLTPTETVGGSGVVTVTVSLGGLQPSTAYHFRFVAGNTGLVSQGEDETFTTAGAESLLPDGRGYEMVTPAENEDAQAYVPSGSSPVGEETVFTSLPVRAAADGQSIAYVGEPTSEGNGSQGKGLGNLYIAKRDSSGWVQRAMQPTGRLNAAYWWLSDDLTEGLLESSEPLLEGAPEAEDLYVRDMNTGSLRSLVPTPPHRTAKEFGVAGPIVQLGAFYPGASSDLEKVFFDANDALTPDAIDGGKEQDNLYESNKGVLRLVNVLPNGTTEPGAVFGSPKMADEEWESDNSWHAISNDGSHVFWTDLNSGSLYVRIDGGETRLIAEDATYLTASSDGSRVVYVKNGDLYEEDLSTSTTTDLEPEGHVLGLAGASEDATYVYFVAEGVLASGARSGQPNLYVHHSSTTQLIATLAAQSESPALAGNGVFNDWRPTIAHRTAQATPDGRHLAFYSVQDLTGYDNRGGREQAAGELYVYDVDSGDLVCASCNPSGERPLEAPEFAAYPSVPDKNTFQIRWISEDGDRVFFQARVSLVPQDTNSETDVYEWERDGSGSCHSTRGCIYLLSGGIATTGSYLLDASTSGNDVFIVTPAQLVAQDQNAVDDVYDVRVGVEAPPAPLQCTGTGCQGLPSSPPTFATPATVTFNGTGNFPAPTKSSASKKKASTKKTSKKKSKRSRAKKRHKKARPTGGRKRRARSKGTRSTRKTAINRGQGR